MSASLSARRAARSSSGIMAKASLVGARRVMSSADARVSARPASVTAVTRVENSGLPARVSTMFWALAASVRPNANAPPRSDLMQVFVGYFIVVWDFRAATRPEVP